MGLRSTIATWLTPQVEERATLPPMLPFTDNAWPFVNFGGMTYPLFGLQQTLQGKTEEVGSDLLGLTGAYRGNGIVFTCLNVRASLFTEARFMYRQLRSGTPGDLFSTRDLEILRSPWPGGTTGDLLGRLIQYVDLAGNAFAVRRGNRIRVPRPDWMTIVLGSDDDPDVEGGDLDAEVLGYIYHPGGHYSGRTPIALLPEEVAHFAPTPDPLATYRGISWLQTLLREIEADSAATSHKLQFFRNGATPNMVVSLDPAITGQAFRDWIELFEKKHSGVANAYKTLYLGAGAKAEVVGANLQQLEFKVTQGAGETRIAAAAGVPPVVAGLSEGLQGSSLNSGNFAASMRRFADLTMRPLWRNVAGSLARIVPVPPAAELWYDPRDIAALKDDIMDFAEVQAKQANAINSLITAGFEPASIVDAINAGDLKRLKHTNLYSVQLQPPQPDGPPKPDVKVLPPEPPKQIPAETGRSELLQYLLAAAEAVHDRPPFARADDEDDHYYGAWIGGKKSKGGHPAAAGGAAGLGAARPGVPLSTLNAWNEDGPNAQLWQQFGERKDVIGGTRVVFQQEQRIAMKEKLMRDIGARIDAEMSREDIEASVLGNALLTGYGSPDRTPGETIAAKLHDLWAETSMDHDESAVALQLVAADEFGLEASDFLEDNSETLAPGARNLAKESRRLFSVYLRAEYEATQEALRKAGVKELTLWRGTGPNAVPGPFEGNRQQRFQMNPLSSWAANPATATSFAADVTGEGGGYVFSVVVPAERVFSTAFTGAGCLSEYEAILLGGPGDEATVWRYEG